MNEKEKGCLNCGTDCERLGEKGPVFGFRAVCCWCSFTTDPCKTCVEAPKKLVAVPLKDDEEELKQFVYKAGEETMKRLVEEEKKELTTEEKVLILSAKRVMEKHGLLLDADEFIKAMEEIEKEVKVKETLVEEPEEEEEEDEEEEVHRLYKVELYIWDYGGDIEHDEDNHGLNSVMIHIDQQLGKYFNASPQLYAYQTKDFKNKILNKQEIDYKKIWDEEEES